VCGSGCCCNSVGVDEFPFLVCSVVLVPDNDCLSFNILVSSYVKNLAGLDIDEVVTLVSKELPPLAVGLPDLDISLGS